MAQRTWDNFDMTKETSLCKIGQKLYDIWEKGIKGKSPKPLWKAYSNHVDICKKCRWHLHIVNKVKLT
jgi:hypothetical protein